MRLGMMADQENQVALNTDEGDFFVGDLDHDDEIAQKMAHTTSGVTDELENDDENVLLVEGPQVPHSASMTSTARSGLKRKLDELEHDGLDPWEYMQAVDGESFAMESSSDHCDESGSINSSQRKHMAAAFKKYYPNMAQQAESNEVAAKKCELVPPAAAVNHSEEAESTVPEPSRFCHICTKSSRMVRQAVCCNLLSGVCRKVICEKCFEENEWDFELAVSEDSGWVCSHCAGVCPNRAQCTFYRKANKKVQVKRKEQRRAARAQKLAQEAGTVSPTLSTSNKMSSKGSDHSESAETLPFVGQGLAWPQGGEQNWMAMAMTAAAAQARQGSSGMFNPLAGLDFSSPPKAVDGQVNASAIMQQMCSLLPFLAAQQMMIYNNMQPR
ncbi:hypothetical protein FVE85_5289 [Porphyridium purpureum]|uniref:Uncharacterized protein n=1 Tax=Porphyridium purpureum TaxID=35688 RepID=A0A5J4Z451_PORPP|nr:hypothetical protein FVE85_5289 [Porphyridium purpureum]|eukprot:POR6155..scf295_1